MFHSLTMKYFMAFLLAVAAQSASATSTERSPMRIITTDPNVISEKDILDMHASIMNSTDNLEEIALRLLLASDQTRYMFNVLYKQNYSVYLIEAMDEHLPEFFTLTFRTLMCSDPSLYASKLRDALAMNNTDVIIDILASLNNEEIIDTAGTYENMTGSTLEDDLINGTSGDFQELLTQIVAAQRSEDPTEDMTTAAQYARLLHYRGFRSQQLFSILTTTSYNQLQAIFDMYYQIFGTTIEESIEQKFSGDTRKCLLTLVKVARDKTGYFAEKIHEALDDPFLENLIFYIITRYDRDLGAIQERYQQIYGRTLVTDLETKVTYESRIFLQIMLTTYFEWPSDGEISTEHPPMNLSSQDD